MFRRDFGEQPKKNAMLVCGMLCYHVYVYRVHHTAFQGK